YSFLANDYYFSVYYIKLLFTIDGDCRAVGPTRTDTINGIKCKLTNAEIFSFRASNNVVGSIAFNKLPFYDECKSFTEQARVTFYIMDPHGKEKMQETNNEINQLL